MRKLLFGALALMAIPVFGQWTNAPGGTNTGGFLPPGTHEQDPWYQRDKTNLAATVTLNPAAFIWGTNSHGGLYIIGVTTNAGATDWISISGTPSNNPSLMATVWSLAQMPPEIFSGALTSTVVTAGLYIGGDGSVTSPVSGTAALSNAVDAANAALPRSGGSATNLVVADTLTLRETGSPTTDVRFKNTYGGLLAWGIAYGTNITPDLTMNLFGQLFSPRSTSAGSGGNLLNVTGMDGRYLQKGDAVTNTAYRYTAGTNVVVSASSTGITAVTVAGTSVTLTIPANVVLHSCVVTWPGNVSTTFDLVTGATLWPVINAYRADTGAFVATAAGTLDLVGNDSVTLSGLWSGGNNVCVFTF